MGESGAIGNSPGKKVTKRLHPNEVWDLVCQAQDEHLSLHRLAKVKRGSSAGSACALQNKLLSMYFARTQLLFKFSRHLTLITDGSTHGGRNTIVTVAFDPLLNTAGFAPCQALSAAKTRSGPCKQLPAAPIVELPDLPHHSWELGFRMFSSTSDLQQSPPTNEAWLETSGVKQWQPQNLVLRWQLGDL